MTEKRDPVREGEHMLGIMERFEKMKLYPALALQMETFGPLLGNAGVDVNARYHALVERAQPCFEIERIHGKGCLLNLDHPLVRRFVLVDGLIDQDRIQAALGYRGLDRLPFDEDDESLFDADDKMHYGTIEAALDAAWVDSERKKSRPLAS
jgi:hypothetical protein